MVRLRLEQMCLERSWVGGNRELRRLANDVRKDLCEGFHGSCS